MLLDYYGIQSSANGKPVLRIPAFAFLYILGHPKNNGATDIYG